MNNLRNLCKKYVLNIERAYNNGELWDYLDEKTIDENIVLAVGGGDKVLIGVELIFDLGGPTVWLDTRKHAVVAAYGSDTAIYFIDTDVCDEINEMYAERFGYY